MNKIDLIIKNASILTLDERNTYAGSVAVGDGKIVHIWPEKYPSLKDEEIATDAQVVDLDGATLIPGFIDTHNHLLMYAQFRKQANCSSPLNKNIAEILQKLEDQKNKTPDGEWVLGWGYDNTLLEENRHPTRQELDTVSSEVPILIRHTSVHFGVANSKALEIAGVDESTADPFGGRLGRDEDGRLNGVLYELPALGLVQSALPSPSMEQLADYIGEATEDYLAEGITTSSDAGVGLDMGLSEFEAHLESLKEGKNPLRMRFMVLHHLLGNDGKFSDYTAKDLDELIRKRSNDRAKLDSAKLFQDGSIQGLTAALREPYHTEPDIMGDLLHKQNEFNEEVLDLHKRGFRIATHGNGDRAIESIIDAYEYALKQEPREYHQHRIEHLQTANDVDFNRMIDLDIKASFFINHIYYWADRHKRYFLGPERTKQMNPLADAEEKGLLYTLHSDCPITPISPLFSIWIAVNRQSMEGEIMGEDQRISPLKALKTMTIDGAKLNFEEDELGSIEVGKLADFAVLDADPTQIDPLKIKDINVLATYISGKKVYEKEM
ncbi:amidohydrolase [Virgibacillus xinjiangensis]|uniref:Amidohydrolase n=1 Tax=Virgibacillus xinjiangensis TaxID=393090 RepID=A0ABV7CUZ3_9BACI